ncbi:hypothetical protein B0A52_06511 [Exophiala mesophila]|uniref:Uncharacterized protein n=1 Tax=Exophiala mesophila TaxID=212818 RepID=A0A438N141_EXOME|nr:hypothetical protein B0A52_06511 [Exophiala mesophila]
MSSYQDIIAKLLPGSSAQDPTSRPLRPLFSLPISPYKPLIPSSHITNLSLHPVLEALLHILNLDLPSAHFLLRHMQADPAWEAMFLHGVLHRIEGDLDNTRAWYKDVGHTEVFEYVWGQDDFPGRNVENDGSGTHGLVSEQSKREDEEESKTSLALKRSSTFLDELDKAKVIVRSGRSPPDHLLEASLTEFGRVLAFCQGKFGTNTLDDASGVWVSMAEKHAETAEKMITGGEGWREF